MKSAFGLHGFRRFVGIAVCTHEETYHHLHSRMHVKFIRQFVWLYDLQPRHLFHCYCGRKPFVGTITDLYVPDTILDRKIRLVCPFRNLYLLVCLDLASITPRIGLNHEFLEFRGDASADRF